MRTQIRAVSVSVGVNVRTSVLTERYREGVSPESPGAWMAAFTKEQRSLTFRDKSPEMFSAKGQTTARFFPPSPASAGAVKRALHGAAFLLHKSARWRLRYNLRGRWGVRPLHTSGSQTQELRWRDGVWMCRVCEWLSVLNLIGLLCTSAIDCYLDTQVAPKNVIIVKYIKYHLSERKLA